MKCLKIGVIGGGVVGRATARCYVEHVAEVCVHDRLRERETNDLISTLESDIVFLCLPEDNVEPFLRCQLPDRLKKANLVLRSTVPIGTTRRLAEQYHLPNLVHSPEFLTARCAALDASMPTRNIIGVPGRWEDSDGANALHCLYCQRFPHVEVLAMQSDESEAVKLFQNGIFAVTVSLWNELRSLSDKLGLDWGAVHSAILADGRIHPSHTLVPGPDGQRGFGGACLPKDLKQLEQCFREAGVLRPIILAADHRNTVMDRRKDC